MEQLYVEVLYTIRHKLGANSAKYPAHVKEDLVHYAQEAFGVDADYHRRCHAIASEEKVTGGEGAGRASSRTSARATETFDRRASIGACPCGTSNAPRATSPCFTCAAGRPRVLYFVDRCD